MDGQTNISKYAIVQRLGTGGMAEVFKCRLSGIGGFEKVVVVKRILPHLVEDESFVSMFLDEARIAANLTHPNIVQVFEIAQDDDGTPFIAMEYVRGPTLSQVLRAAAKAGQLHIGRMVKLIMGAAQGLDYAHLARGPDGEALHIVHRDISPQNMLVSFDGVPKLLDFGVAKADGRITHTQGGVLKGKIRFMAPELLVDPNAELDGRADLFSLGVCLYVCTTARLPFTGDNDLQIMQAIAAGTYPKPSDIVPGYPPELEEIVAWTLATDRDQRCPTGQALADRLAAWLAQHPEGTSDQDVSTWITALFPEMESGSWGGGQQSSAAIGGHGTPISKVGSRPRMAGLATPSGLRAPSGSGLRAPTGTGLAAALRPPSGVGPSPTVAPTPAEAPLLDGEVDISVEMTQAGQLPPAGPGPVTPAPSRRGLMVVGLVVVALLVAGGVFVATRSPPAPPPAPVVAAVAAPGPASIAPYLDEADALLAAGKVRAARDLAQKARATGALAPTEDIRLSRLERALRLAGWLESAKKALDEGHFDMARQQLAQVDEEEPGYPPALALREALQAKEAELAAAAQARGPEVEKAPQKVPEKAGRLSAPVGATTTTGAHPSPFSLQSEPDGATVTIDGEPAGTTPLSGVPLKPGEHRVRLSKPGFLASEERVLAAGRPLSALVRLVPEPSKAPVVEAKARLLVTTSTPAMVSVDGVVAGPAPFASEALTAGRHTVAASAEGYQSATQEVTLVAGEARTAALVLAKVEVLRAPEPVKAGPQAPGLPRVFDARTLQDLTGALRTVEMSAVSKGGLEVRQVKNTTALLGTELSGSLSPGSVVELYPAGMYWFIVRGVQAGKAPGQIARELKAAHFANELADLAR